MHITILHNRMPLTHQPSPILEQKYAWQEREYEKTRELLMREYARSVEERVERLIKQSGYRAVPRGERAFRLTRERAPG